MKHKNINGAVVLFSLAALALGVRAGYILYRDVKLSVESAGWPAVQGYIVSNKIKLSSIATKPVHAKWEPDLKYSYSVDGIHYIGSRISYPIMRGSKTAVQAKIENFPVGSRVQVYYNPNDKNISCLEPGKVKLWIIIMFGLGCALLIIGGMWGIFSQIKKLA